MPPLVNKTKTTTSPLANKNRSGSTTSSSVNKANNDKNNKARTSSTRSRSRWRLCEAPQQILEKVYSTKNTGVRVSPRSIGITMNDTQASMAYNSQNVRSLIVDNLANVQPIIATPQIDVQESSRIFNTQNMQAPIMDSVQKITVNPQESIMLFNASPNFMNKLLVNKQELMTASNIDSQ